MTNGMTEHIEKMSSKKYKNVTTCMDENPTSSVELRHDGIFYPLNVTHTRNGCPTEFQFFRKYIKTTYEYATTCFYRRQVSYPNHESDICRMLIEQQRVGRKHPNIVYVYRAYDDFTDVELVRPITSMSPLIVKKMRSVMEYLHELGIAYVDWKIDNIGIGVDGEVKLFDFDGSGIFNVNDSEVWVQKAPKFYMYRKAVDTMLQNGIKPRNICDIDRWAFSDGIMELDKLKQV